MPLWPLQQKQPALGAYSNLQTWAEVAGAAPLLTTGDWSVARLAVYVPIRIPVYVPAARLSVWWGSSTDPSSIEELGLYSSDDDGLPFEQLATTTDVTPLLTDFTQTFGLIPSKLNLSPDLYYLAMVATGTQAIIRAGATEAPRAFGVFVEVDAYPLPAVANPLASTATVNIPILSLTIL